MSKLAVAIVVSEFLALWVAWRVLRTSDPLPLRIATALVAFIPFVGPVFAYWAANFPPPNHPALRDNRRYSSDVFDRWASVLRMPHSKKRVERWKAIVEDQGQEDERAR